MLPKETTTSIKTTVHDITKLKTHLDFIQEKFATLCPENNVNFDLLFLTEQILTYRKKAMQYLSSTYGERVKVENLVINLKFEIVAAYVGLLAQWVVIDSIDKKPIMCDDRIVKLHQWQCFS